LPSDPSNQVTAWLARWNHGEAAARLMRGILVDPARRHGAAKRGGDAVTLVLDEAGAAQEVKEVDLVARDDALICLATLDARHSQIVELRFCGGLAIEDVAQVLGISPAPVKREWPHGTALVTQCHEQDG
jgi:RNA polymerase sigma-70 factor, ECF subfamily